MFCNLLLTISVTDHIILMKKIKVIHRYFYSEKNYLQLIIDVVAKKQGEKYID